ncbi:MAG: AhpC/TSA family protein [Bacteroidales bacterium]|nr:AhpC/TSA family protein [Bacteroidales bacterium]
MQKIINITNRLLLAAMAVALFSCGSKSENGYTIKGTVPAEVSAEWMYLYSVDSGMPVAVDSVRIVKNSFTFKGVADSVNYYVLHPGTFEDYPAVGWNVILEPGDIVADTMGGSCSGTPLNDALKTWMTDIEMAQTPEVLPEIFASYWDTHSSDFLGAFMLSNMSPYMRYDLVDSLARQIPDEVSNRAIFKPFFDRLKAFGLFQPGNPFTDVQFTTLDGNPVSLSDYVGKGDYVLVDFWASWCGPCRQATPQVQTIAAKFKKLKVLVVAINDKPEDSRKAIADLKIKWPVVSDSEGAAPQTYGFNAIPFMMLFSPDGIILARDFTDSALEEILNENLK